jgi:hypothetical protein
VAAPALTLRLLRSGDGTPLKADASRGRHRLRGAPPPRAGRRARALR